MGCRVSKTAEVGAEEAAIELEGGNAIANVNNTASNNKQAAQSQSSGAVFVLGTVEAALTSSQTFSPEVRGIVHHAGLDDILRGAPKGTGFRRNALKCRRHNQSSCEQRHAVDCKCNGCGGTSCAVLRARLQPADQGVWVRVCDEGCQ